MAHIPDPYYSHHSLASSPPPPRIASYNSNIPNTNQAFNASQFNSAPSVTASCVYNCVDSPYENHALGPPPSEASLLTLGESGINSNYILQEGHPINSGSHNNNGSFTHRSFSASLSSSSTGMSSSSSTSVVASSANTLQFYSAGLLNQMQQQSQSNSNYPPFGSIGGPIHITEPFKGTGGGGGGLAANPLRGGRNDSGRFIPASLDPVAKEQNERAMGGMGGLVNWGGRPVITHSCTMGTVDSCNEYEEDPPLLEELGINLDHIFKRMKSVLFFYRLDHDLLADCDMCGPLLIVLLLGFSLLLSGKATFGYIYGLGISGCFTTYVLLNLMGQTESIDLYHTMSILGYGLLPADALAITSILLNLKSTTGTGICIACVLWCTATASRFFETALRMHHQRYLVAYPIGLLYACFVLIIVF